MVRDSFAAQRRRLTVKTSREVEPEQPTPASPDTNAALAVAPQASAAAASSAQAAAATGAPGPANAACSKAAQPVQPLAALAVPQHEPIDDVKRACLLRAKYRKEERVRLPPSLLGFHPFNRDGLGINPDRIEEVLSDLLGSFEIGEAEHDAVCVEEEPGKDTFLQFNNARCRGDDRLTTLGVTSMGYATIGLRLRAPKYSVCYSSARLGSLRNAIVLHHGYPLLDIRRTDPFAISISSSNLMIRASAAVLRSFPHQPDPEEHRRRRQRQIGRPPSCLSAGRPPRHPDRLGD